MTPRPRLPAPGFTLVELQIALLIVAVMAALMSGALRLSSKTWASVHQQQDQVEHRYFLAQYLRRHLSNARFMRVTTADEGTVIGFFGNGETINFVAPWPAFHNDGELYWWNLALQWDEERRQYDLLASYFPYDDGSRRPRTDSSGRDDEDDTGEEFGASSGRAVNFIDPFAEQALLTLDNDGRLRLGDIEPSTLVLARDVQALEFEYFYRDEEGVQDWLRDWEPGNNTPLVIRVNLDVAETAPGADGGKYYAPLTEIIVTPRFADQKLHADVFDGRR